MLLLLLVLATAVSLLPGVTAQFERTLDITECPVKFYGTNYTTLFVNITNGRAALCFKAPYVDGEPNDCLIINRTEADREVFYSPNTTTCDSQGNFIHCNATAHLHAVPQINDYCVQGAICTVTGSTIIDYSDNSTSVDDRCAYTLFSNSSVHVVGVFKERRRKDVMFLDRVVMELLDYDYVIQLGPGVKVLVNNTYVNISSVFEEHEGLDLHQDQTGVTVTIYQSDYNITVFFNGDTAQILLTHPWMLAGRFLLISSFEGLIY
ncbi:uncharacterized protein LOC133659232 [Entelurus aequoreus]|uniref:uncharacterized protein LOC133659232 n=1 Tax=Entelurus aequoreus TaxID=161455 RepID=UPI002B1DC39B|nr:uncharacterized protein LOC133659232 [Entelurus aequoreus]